MDKTRDLWSLVESARQQQQEQEHREKDGQKATAAVLSKKQHPLRNVHLSAEEQQTQASLLSTMNTLNKAVIDAVHRAATHVQAVLTALDAATPSSTAHLQNSLLLSDAELLSVSSSLKAFAETLAKVHAVTAALQKMKDRKGRSVTDTTSVDEDNTSLQMTTMEATSSGPGSSGLVAHLRQAVRIQEQRVAFKRLQVTLAKEELALYKSELYLYGHCGVLSCSDAEAAQLAQWRAAMGDASTQGGAAEGDAAGPTRLSQLSPTPPSRAASPKPSKSGFGTTFRMVDGIVQRAAQTVKAAGNHADSALHVALTGSQAAARQLLNVGTASVDGIVMLGATAPQGSTFNEIAASAATGTATIGALPLPPLVQDTFTREEEARLQEQSQALLQVQHEASAQDAKAVEASIRELSQLTSLMNEQVVQQTEQFSILVKNTETAHSNVQKAVGEVKKPLQAFWNPTRQLIALLWSCMALLLAVNWALR